MTRLNLADIVGGCDSPDLAEDRAPMTQSQVWAGGGSECTLTDDDDPHGLSHILEHVVRMDREEAERKRLAQAEWDSGGSERTHAEIERLTLDLAESVGREVVCRAYLYALVLVHQHEHGGLAIQGLFWKSASGVGLGIACHVDTTAATPPEYDLLGVRHLDTDPEDLVRIRHDMVRGTFLAGALEAIESDPGAITAALDRAAHLRTLETTSTLARATRALARSKGLVVTDGVPLKIESDGWDFDVYLGDVKVGSYDEDTSTAARFAEFVEEALAALAAEEAGEVEAS